jgi:glutathione synthase
VSATPPHTAFGARETLDLAAIDAVFIRKDPPFDAAYLYLTHELDLVAARTLVVNAPAAVRSANEKLYALRFSHLMPRTLVTSDPERILSFVTDAREAIIKPLDGAGGTGVIALTAGDRSVRAIVDLLTGEGQRLAMVQEFLPVVREGDKRVLLLDGRPLGAIRRVPRSDDIRANIHVGGPVQATELSAAEEKLVMEIGAVLSAEGLWFVGLDLIGEKLIEVNVTSPTGIQELGRLTGTTPELKVIEWVETACRKDALRR